MKLLKFSTTLLVFQLVLCHAVFAQDAQRILKKLQDYNYDVMDKVDDMEVIMNPEGAIAGYDRMIMFYKKEMVDGKPTFKSHVNIEGGMGEQIAGSTNSMMQGMDMFAMGARMYEGLKDVATYKGEEVVDGEKTDLIYVADMTAFMDEIMGRMQSHTGLSQMGAKVTDVHMYVDQKKPVVRKLTMSTHVNQGGMVKAVQTTMLMSDFRQVGPVYQPFATKTIIENPMSPEQRAEIKKQREQIEAMLENLPEDQQGPIAQMLEAFSNDQIEISVLVEDLKINEGVPAEYFN